MDTDASDPWNGKAGPLMWQVATEIITTLQGKEPQRRTDVTALVASCTGALPKTVDTVARALARFGVIYFGNGTRRRTWQLTVLGARWWNNR